MGGSRDAYTRRRITIGNGATVRSPIQGKRINVCLTGIIRNMLHQLRACCSSSAITQSARLSLMSPSIPLTARVRLRLPCALRPARPPFSRFSWQRLKTDHRSSFRSSYRRGVSICASVTGWWSSPNRYVSAAFARACSAGGGSSNDCMASRFSSILSKTPRTS